MISKSKSLRWWLELIGAIIAAIVGYLTGSCQVIG